MWLFAVEPLVPALVTHRSHSAVPWAALYASALQRVHTELLSCSVPVQPGKH